MIHTATNTNNPYATACFWFCPCCIEKLYTLPCNQPFTPISSIRSIARSACCIFLHFLPVAMEVSFASIHVPMIPLQGKAWSWIVMFSARRAMQRIVSSTTQRWREGRTGMYLSNPSSALCVCSLHGLDMQEDRALVCTSCGGDGILPLLGPHVHLFVPSTIRCVDGDGVVSMTWMDRKFLGRVRPWSTSCRVSLLFPPLRHPSLACMHACMHARDG